MHNTLWDHCLNALKADISEQNYNTWIKPLYVIEDEEGPSLTLLAPNKFVVNWVQKNYLEQIKAAAEKKLRAKTTVAISVGGEKQQQDKDKEKKEEKQQQDKDKEKKEEKQQEEKSEEKQQ